MRLMYFLLKYILKIPLWIYYPRTKNVNKPKKRFARTIFTSNHAASFMDPLVVAATQPPIVFFMTRSDVFTPLLKPILWASHMFPIYRQLDGQDTKAKNERVFQKCYRVLKYGRSLLIFSEGFTDDVFIRRLKPVKKGAVRIGFGALEHLNWKKPIYIQAVGANYSNPNRVGSDLIISNSEPLCLNNYKEDFLRDPNKTIHDLTLEVERRMRAQITDVRNKKWAPLHEMIMRITRKGMHDTDTDKNIPLLERWEYSKQLAHWLNEHEDSHKDELGELKEDLQRYFDELKRLDVQENDLFKVCTKNWSKWRDRAFLILLFPFTLLGLVNNYLPYMLVKKFVERSFKRRVFWGSVKMMLGALAVGLFNLIFLFGGYYLVHSSWSLWLMYYFLISPLSGVIAYNWFLRFKQLRRRSKMQQNTGNYAVFTKRKKLLHKIQEVIPVA